MLKSRPRRGLDPFKTILALALPILLLVPASASAVPNLPLSCAGPLGGDGKCPEASYQFIPGRNGLRVATPSGVWMLWEELNDQSSVRVCPSDIPSGTLCPVARVTVPKVQASGDTGAPSTYPVKITWVAPTQAVDGAALPAGEIVGYKLSWRVPPTSLPTEISLGNVTEYSFRAPGSEICFAIAAEGKSAFSDASPWVCVTPGRAKIVPLPPQEVRIIIE